MSGEVITGVMYGLESDLEKYPEPGEPNRARVIRFALRAVEASGWDEGYRAGFSDGRDERKPVSEGQSQ